jgi:hypothetical protein
MENDNNNEGGLFEPSEKTSKRRDDTPSFIRDVNSRAELLNPQRESIDYIPVLTMPKSQRIWRQIRWPLLVLAIVTVLVSVGLVTFNYLVSRNVQHTIEEAQIAENMGAIKPIQHSGETLSGLAKKHPDRSNAQAAWAWHAVLQAELLGPTTELSAEAITALELAGSVDHGYAWAARAGTAHLAGDYAKALELADKGIAKYSNEPRLALVRIWSLASLGKIEEARKTLDAAISQSIEYLPLLIAGIKIELDAGNRLEALELAGRLLSVSPGNLYGSLVTIDLGLPGWGAGLLGEARIDTLVKDLGALKPHIDSAPPKLAVLGNYLDGRVNLIAGRFGEAIKAFSWVMEKAPTAEVLGWYASAVYRHKGPQAALDLINSKVDLTGPEVFDITATSLLLLHRVSESLKAIDVLAESGIYQSRTSQLRWIHAIRSGNVKGAITWLPKSISEADQLLAMEMYLLLKGAGDREGIEKLTDALEENFPACRTAIQLWHDSSVKRGFRALIEPEESDTCVDIMASALLKGHITQEDLKQKSDRIVEISKLNQRFEIIRALAIWPSEGHAAAVSILEKVAQLEPEGALLRNSLAQAYLDLGLPQKSVTVLKDAQDPEGLALRIFALRGAGKKDEAAELVKQAIGRGEEENHPAFTFFMLQSQFSAGKIHETAAAAIKAVNSGKLGHWTTEVAQIGSRALNFIGDKVEAEKLLTTAAKLGGKSAGLDESLEARLAQIHLNVVRGGKFLYRAIFLINELREAGLKDPRLDFNYAMVNIKDGNDRFGLRYLNEALTMDPTFKQAYKQLASMNKLDEQDTAAMNKMWPGYTP